MSEALAYIDDNVYHRVMMHSRGLDGSSSRDIAGALAETYGLKRQRHLTMGSSYQTEVDYTKITALSQVPSMHVSAERHAMSDLNDNNPNFAFQMDMIAAAGAMVAELKDVILEISAMGEDLSVEQKAKFVQAIFNTYQLQQAQEGRIELSAQQLEALSLDTIEVLDSLAKDMVLPQGLKTISTSIMRDLADRFGLDTVNARLDRFERETSPKALMDLSLEGLMTTLNAMLDTDDLDDATREKIEEILEKLEQLEDGEPLPRDLMKDLKALAENMQNQKELGLLSTELALLVDDLKQDVFKVSEANIGLKADKFNLTIAQVRAIESMMDRLDEIAENLPESEAELKAEIQESVQLLDTEPTSLKATEALETLAEKMNSPRMQKLIEAFPVLSSIVNAFSTEQKFIQKIQMDGITKKHDGASSFVRETLSLYRALDVVRTSLLFPPTQDTSPLRLPPEFKKQADPDLAPKKKIESNLKKKSDAELPAAPSQNTIEQIEQVMRRLEDKPDSIVTATEARQLFDSESFKEIVSELPEGIDIIDAIKHFDDGVIEKIANNTGQSPEDIREWLDDITREQRVESLESHDLEVKETTNNDDQDRKVVKEILEEEFVENQQFVKLKEDPHSDAELEAHKNPNPDTHVTRPEIELSIDQKLNQKLNEEFGVDEKPEDNDNKNPCDPCALKGECKKAQNKAAKDTSSDDDKKISLEKEVETPKPKKSLAKKKPSMVPK